LKKNERETKKRETREMEFHLPIYLPHRMFTSPMAGLMHPPWISPAPTSYSYLNIQQPSFETQIMPSLLNVMNMGLLERVMSRWIEQPLFRRPVPIRRPRIRRRAPIRRRFRLRRAAIRRQPVQLPRKPIVKPTRVQQWGPQQQQQVRRRRPQQLQPIRRQQVQQLQPMRRPVSQPMRWTRPVSRQPRSMSRSRSASRQRSVSRTRAFTQQPQYLGRQQPTMRLPKQQLGRQQQVSSIGSIGRQVPIQYGRQIPIQGGRKQMPQSIGGLGRQVSGIQQQKITGKQSFGKQLPIPQQQQKKQVSGGMMGQQQKTSTKAGAVTGQKLPQLYRICVSCKDFDPSEVECGIRCESSGQCNLIMDCGGVRKCFTLPRGCDYKKMKPFVAGNMYVCEFPLMEAPRCLDIACKPQIKENNVTLRICIPEYIDPSKVQVNLKGNDLILRCETQLSATRDCACRVYYHNKVPLPEQTNLSMLKCVRSKGALCISAPIIGGVQRGGLEQQPRGISVEKKMRHRKLKMLQQQPQQQQGVVKGGVKQGKVTTGRELFKLPKPEEIGGGLVGGKKPSKKQPLQQQQVTKQ
jgi:hypothetical protein